MKSIFCRCLVWFVLLCSLWAGGMAIRQEVFKQQTRTLEGKEAPFLMESALQFRMTQMVAETGTLPEVDEKVQVPDGVNMRKTYSVGAEWVYTGLAKWLPGDWTFTHRIRWVSTALFCLSIPLAALWVGLKYHSILGGMATGGLLILSPAFAVRSSGLELSRENLAIPLFVLFLLAESLYADAKSKRMRMVWALTAAVAIALAQSVWDLTQYIIGLWVVWSLFQRIKDQQEPAPYQGLIRAVTLSVATVAVLNPYLRAHGFFFSPIVALLVARCLLTWMPSRFNGRTWLIGMPVATWLLWTLLGQFFVENYSHFGELLYAKIRYLNHKPEDPGLLNYAQRIMWTPALNSSTWPLTKYYFPLVLWVFGIAMLMLIRGVKQGRRRFQAEFFYAGFTLAVYVFFFRFHVFLILFVAVCIGAAFASFQFRKGCWGKWILPLVGLILLLGTEFYLLLFFEPKPASAKLAEQQQILQIIRSMGGNETMMQKGNRWGRPGAAYGYVDELVNRLSELPEMEKGPVLANFGISATILAETEMPIVLHPKFETPGIRERVREFYEHLFLKSEKELRDWAVKFGARYYVHSMGNFSDADPRNSPRYMVDAMEPPAGSAIYHLENEPQNAVWFRPVYSNARFRIYRIVTPEDEEMALSYTRLAAIAFESGDYEKAQKWAMLALSFHWKFPQAQNVLQAALSQARP
ncbi:hypothetical protein P0Y35_12880 [Kiritimatiellaeota bacterium B1221]|nr:hypothetical protein [Kiritimatiellaeota bacterium B1221]